MLSPKHEEVQDVFRKRRRGRKCDWDALHTLPAAGLHCWLHTDLYLMLKVRNMGWLTCFSISYSLVGSESRLIENNSSYNSRFGSNSCILVGICIFQQKHIKDSFSARSKSIFSQASPTKSYFPVHFWFEIHS